MASLINLAGIAPRSLMPAQTLPHLLVQALAPLLQLLWTRYTISTGFFQSLMADQMPDLEVSSSLHRNLTVS